MSGTILVEPLDAGDSAVRERLARWLAPHETRVMFILGNLRAGARQMHLYVARRGRKVHGRRDFSLPGRTMCFYRVRGRAAATRRIGPGSWSCGPWSGF